MENLFQEECTLSKDSVERYGIAMKKHAQEWVAEIEQMMIVVQIKTSQHIFLKI